MPDPPIDPSLPPGIPARFSYLEHREGLVAIGVVPIRHAQLALRRSLATMRQALEVFDAVHEALGARVWLDPEGGAHRRRLYLRDPDAPAWLVPVPLLTHAWSSGDRTTSIGPALVNKDPVLPADAPPGWKYGDPWFRDDDRLPDIVPRGPDMRAGLLRIDDGMSYAEVRFNDRGVGFECSSSGGDLYTATRYDASRPHTVDSLARPPTGRPLALFCRADLDARGHDAATFARMICEIPLLESVPARVMLPVPIPGGAAAVLATGLAAIRRALWHGDLPADQGWVVTDGFEGRVMLHGSSLADAMRDWDATLFRLKPRPPQPLQSPAEAVEHQPPETFRDADGNVTGVSTGTIVLQGPAGADLAWPAAVPRNVPAVAVALTGTAPPVPDGFRAIGFTHWIRLLDDEGRSRWALRRDEPGGELTLIGDGIIDLLDAETFDAELAAGEERVERDWADFPPEARPDATPGFEWGSTQFSCWDSDRRMRTEFRQASGTWGATFVPQSIGANAAWGVVHARRVRGR